MEVMGAGQLKISLAHVARTKEGRMAFGLPASGYQPYWKQLIPALGFKFPPNARLIDSESAFDDDDSDDFKEEALPGDDA